MADELLPVQAGGDAGKARLARISGGRRVIDRADGGREIAFFQDPRDAIAYVDMLEGRGPHGLALARLRAGVEALMTKNKVDAKRCGYPGAEGYDWGVAQASAATGEALGALLRDGEMTRPVRVQRRRTKGWRMPGNTVYVGRGSRWGNPFRAVREGGFQWVERPDGTRVSNLVCSTDRAGTRRRMLREAVEHFKTHTGFMGDFEMDRAEIRAALAGKNLACWCGPEDPCHADVLLEIANEDPAVMAATPHPGKEGEQP